jgi:hypothetical protein
VSVASASSAPMVGRGHDSGRRTRPTKRTHSRRAAGLAASGRAAARHTPLAQGADRHGLRLSARRRRGARLRALDPQQGRSRPGTSQHPEPSFGRRPRGPAEGLYRPATLGAAARPAAAGRPRPADPQCRRRTEHRQSRADHSRSRSTAPCAGDRGRARQPALCPDQTAAADCWRHASCGGGRGDWRQLDAARRRWVRAE